MKILIADVVTNNSTVKIEKTKQVTDQNFTTTRLNNNNNNTTCLNNQQQQQQ